MNSLSLWTLWSIICVSGMVALGLEWLARRFLDTHLARLSLLTTVIFVLMMLLLAQLAQAALPAPQRVAQKALAGEYGELEAWQHKGYTLLWEHGAAQGQLAWITVYNENDPGCNMTTASGRRVSHRVAAMIDKAWGTYVLVSLPDGYQIRQIYDTGSRRNISRARRKGAQTWIDLYYSPQAMQSLRYGSLTSWVRDIYVF